jgi:hypothetical protein
VTLLIIRNVFGLAYSAKKSSRACDISRRLGECIAKRRMDIFLPLFREVTPLITADILNDILEPVIGIIMIRRE